MKQTIISKCFSKMKRVALTLFAALCVGSVWAANPTVYLEARCALSAQGVLSVSDSFAYFGKTSARTFTTKVSYKVNDGEIKTVSLNTTDSLKPSTTSSSSAIWRGGDYTTNVEGFTPGDVVWVKYELAYSGEVGGKTSQSKEYTFDTNGVVESAGSWAFSPNRFLVTGTVPVGKGIEYVKIRYALNSELFSNEEATTDTLLAFAAAQEKTVNADNQGKFVFEIPFSVEHSTLVWSLWAVFNDGTEKLYTDAAEETSLLKMERKENSYVKYTWNGNGGNDAWDNPLNWTMEGLGWGFPGLINDNIDGVYVAGTDGARSTVCFAGNAEIDLGGKTYDFYEQDDKDIKYVPYRGLEFEKPDNMEKMEVVLKNGTIGTKIPGDENGSLLLGAKDVSLEFSNATFAIRGATKLLVPNEGSTIIFSGDYGHDWSYAPRADYSKDSKVMFKNFSGYAYYDRGLTVADGSVLEINNSIIKFRVGTKNTHTAGQGFAKRVVLRDGPDDQAIMRVCYLSSGEDYYASLNLNNTYDIKIPAAGHEDANIWARNLTAEPTATFEIEVTDYLKGDRVPLINLSQTPTYKTLPALVAKANGQDVTAARNARLFWDGKILYYQQDKQYAAEVGGVEYATFADAFAAAEAGATVKLLKDATLAEKITVKKAVTLDLNGCTLSETVTDSYGAIYIGTAGNLTITDSATGGKIATDGGIVIGNYGTVTVAGGTIEAGAVAEEDASVYNFYYNGSTYGKLTVNGGKVGRIWNCGNANITAGEVVDIDNSGAMTIAEAATVSGTVIIKNGSDAAEVPGAGTLTAPESLTVQVGNDGAEAFYVDGKWLVQVVVATIGEAKFASLDAAIAAAGATDTITLVKDIELTSFVSIAKSLTLDLNGKSINRADGTALYVNGDATVTIQGEGSVSGAQAVYVGAGTVVIKGGNFHGYNGGHAVYVQGTGNVEILGGTFSIDEDGTYDYVLNEYDQTRDATSIVVKGGKFKGFNPGNNGAEGANTDFCAEGLCGYVVETVDGVDFYGVAAAVAAIGEAKFATLDAAIAAAGAEDEVVVVADIATDAAFEITKKVAINLNGKTIATTEKDTEGNGVFWVKSGGELTLNGEGTVNGVGGNAYNIAIWADGGKVIINGGTYTNEGAQDDGPDGAHFDLIYVKNGGAVEINGGTFKCETPNWTLNSHDTAKGTIVVKGGTFYQFNPANCATEGAGTNFCAANYRAEADGEWYVVKEGYTITVEKPVVTVQTEAAANAVTLNVVAPEGLTEAQKEAYLGYFEKKITANAEGDYTVELALKDELKPVIAETTPAITFEDGKVTVNIENELPGLYYGVRYATTVDAVDAAEIVPGFTVTPDEGDTAGFFKVVVDFKEIK